MYTIFYNKFQLHVFLLNNSIKGAVYKIVAKTGTALTIKLL